MKFVLFASSNTQRVTAQVNETSVLLTKEYRKSTEEDWKIGKGITISTSELIFLGNLLRCESEDEFYRLLTGYEVLKEDNN